MKTICVLALLTLSSMQLGAQQSVSFQTSDGWTIRGDLYGSGERGVLLVHGGRFTKESWSEQAAHLVKAGFCVLAIDLRGFGASQQGPPSLNPGFGSSLDVVAAMRYLRERGVRRISIVGASMGADAAAEASISTRPGEIDRLILLAGSASEPADALKGRKLFVVTEGDANAAGARLPAIRRQYEAANDPKELLVLGGSAHAQFIFQTDQGDRLMRELLRFLTR
jgi:pimeloyl-ACP methyl ester carboxylesterase